MNFDRPSTAMMDRTIDDLVAAKQNQKKMTLEEEVALYKEVTGKDLEIIPIASLPVEEHSLLHYFAELGGTEK